MEKTRHVCSENDYHYGEVLGHIDSSRTMVIQLIMDMKWSNRRM